jgi:zinc protease
MDFAWKKKMNAKQIVCSIIALMVFWPANLAICQQKGFDQARVKQIKQYKSTVLENGLTIIQLDSKDTNNCFIRISTNLPEFVSKSYRTHLEIENEIRRSSRFELPIGWPEEIIKENQILLKKDESGFFATFPNDKIEMALLLFSDLFQKPSTHAEQLENIKRDILVKSDSLNNLPYTKIDKITKSIIYGKDHPMLKQISKEEVNLVNFENYSNFREKFYKPNNSCLLVIGHISLDSIQKMALKSLALWKKKDVPTSDYKLIPIEEPKIVFFDTVPSGQTGIKILFPFALYPFTFDVEKAELLSLVFQDVLSDKLIRDKKLATGIETKFESDKITGNYQVQVWLAKDSLLQVIGSIIETITSLKAGQIPEEKLNQAKKQIIEDFTGHNTDDIYISKLIMNGERNNLSKEYYANFVEEIQKTDKQGMMTFAAKYLNYSTALFQIPGKWYASLNDFIKLSENFRIELYALDGNIKKVIPKGFNGFSVINNYVDAVGGIQNIKKIKEVTIKYGAIYEMPNTENIFIDGMMLHKSDDKYFSESYMIRPKKDTLFLSREIYNGVSGMDSSMQGRKILEGTALELLKYKAPFVPEMKYKDWQYQAKLSMADTLNGNYVWVVKIENPAKQLIIDYYDVDKGVRYKREIKDQQYFNERVVFYSRYQKDKDDEILYPYLKIIKTNETTIRMLIREVNYEAKSDKKLFEFN